MATLSFFPHLGPTELVIILVLALLIFGKRLPEVGKSLGRGIVEFRKGVQGLEEEVQTEVRKPANPPSAAQPQTQPALQGPEAEVAQTIEQHDAASGAVRS